MKRGIWSNFVVFLDPLAAAMRRTDHREAAQEDQLKVLFAVILKRVEGT